jgi:hypothetical protein
LLDNGRCSDAHFRVDEVKAHLSFQSLIGNRLRKNICRLRGPDVLTKDIGPRIIDEHVLPPLRYACLYWAQHVQLSRNAPILRHSVNNFMREHFLYWLEVLGLVGRMTKAVEMIALLGTLYVRQLRG